ncbi:hypothetical protein pf16_06 [Pseudomonas phage pf16]|uniref:Uncharacterized protein n=1 Tax=Pseudomonas phage pf16 TaxID=1815630 RepID=A0A1S5R3F9_9CAUD|nr:hypothetical protein FDG98_gp005 [Pseudomonas phage pf16]AND74929.1 hypothetical protein pf16_06 [Pseudomonas phage pf16]
MTKPYTQTQLLNACRGRLSRENVMSDTLHKAVNDLFNTRLREANSDLPVALKAIRDVTIKSGCVENSLYIYLRRVECDAWSWPDEDM